MALSCVNLFKISLVSNRLNTRLRGDDLVVAGYDGYRPKLEALGEMHRRDANLCRNKIHLVVQHGKGLLCPLNRRSRARDFGFGTNNHTNFLRSQAFGYLLAYPFAYATCLRSD